MATPRWFIFLALALLGGCDPRVDEDSQAALAACLGTCSDRGLSATDQATCRLNCAESTKSPPLVTRPPALAATANCLGKCEAGSDGAAKDACVAACRPQDMAPAALDSLTACVAGCQGGDDDRATCRLHCAQSATP